MVRRRTTLTKGVKDYIVPIIGFVLILILIFSFFSGGNTPVENPNENRTWVNVNLDSVATQWIIEFPNGDTKPLASDTQLYKWEKLLIENGSISLWSTESTSLKLSKNGELKYGEDGNYTLFSSDLWVNTQAKIHTNMRYGQVTIGEGSSVSLAQNEVQSSVYLLKGFAEVSNTVGVSTVLAPGEKVVIERKDADNKELDLTWNKDEIDDYFINSDWFIRNNGSQFLSWNTDQETQTGSTQKQTSSQKRTIVLNNLIDESNVSAGSISISGNYSDETIEKVSLNGRDATINKENKSFVFSGVDVSSRENDLVFKVYDDANDLLEKFVYVVYFQSGEKNSSSTTGSFSVKNYQVDGSKFTFTAPSSKNTFSTPATFVTIKGKVLEKGVASVKVNGYKLNSFNGSTWRYHADVKYDNLKNGTNVYEVQYFDANGKQMYTNYYTIVKKSNAVPKKETKTISGEVKL